ncbi:MAG: family 20 glycosylhydrolase, partial [Planctomycetota bacterium]
MASCLREPVRVDLRARRLRRTLAVAAIALAVGFIAERAGAEAADKPAFVPTPKTVTMGQGTMPLTAASRIVAADASLKPLAAVLAEDIRQLTGLSLETDTGQGRDGDIVLKIDPELRADADIPAVQGQKIVKTRDFAHTIRVANKALVEGWDYRAVAEGTATILQAISGKDGSFALPRMTVKDWPGADYTGTMVDLARQHIPVDAIKAVVDACRLWKIRYCQLHLSDDEGFTFPSTAFPKLGTKNQAAHNGIVPRVYTLKELKDLVAYADARGVTLVPELETPGHSDAMGRAMPEVFSDHKIMDISSDEMYKALDTLVGEMCEVFKSSPYFHIGCDEMYYFQIEDKPSTNENLKKRGLKNLDEAFIQHVERMNAMVRSRGKMTLAWEGVAIPGEGRGYKLPPALTSQVICMCWFPWDYTGSIQEQGFTTITVPWD